MFDWNFWYRLIIELIAFKVKFRIKLIAAGMRRLFESVNPLTNFDLAENKIRTCAFALIFYS